MSDPAKYRSPAEHAMWKERDPIPNFGKKLVEQGMLVQDRLKEIQSASSCHRAGGGEVRGGVAVAGG